MELEERVSALERRLAELEGRGPRDTPAAGAVSGGDFWALEHLKAELDEAGVTAGAVLFTGAVQLSPQERYEWQATTPADALLAEDEPADSATADALAALGHPLRLQLLRGVLGGIHTVAELAELPEVGTTGQIYHHLRQLAGAGWLHTTGRGKYGVPAARVVPLLVVLSAARR
ncbi:ArsR/SmtB family transcription factor [Streptomyces sp. CA-111067]|uniref:ArsR/SmtB family transcription factor n=1 Tax=Streptomyces sp. CA-111067 TaxID=3240046 RepID=UPI003D973B57